MRTMQTDIEVALAAAQAGAVVITSTYDGNLERIEKSSTDFATAADVAAEWAIRTVIERARPRDAFEGEETGTSGDGQRRWLVDPLCGTLNYAAHTQLVAVNVALHDSEVGVRTAVSADPFANELFWTDGVGAQVHHDGVNTPLKPSAGTRLIDVSCDGSGDIVGPKLVADSEFRTEFGPRVISSTLAVAWVAAGRRAGYVTDGDLEGSVHFSAGIAICQSAGCIVTNLAGGPIHSGPGLIAAADERTHQALREIVARL